MHMVVFKWAKVTGNGRHR